jgi:hypothetical protein
VRVREGKKVTERDDGMYGIATPQTPLESIVQKEKGKRVRREGV